MGHYMAGKTVFIIGVSLLIAVMLRTEAAACRECGCNKTYGGYCNTLSGDGYGARRSVQSAEDVRNGLAEYYGGSGTKTGKIIDKTTYFEAEILDNENKIIDRVVIHKRSGRIRSIR